MRLNKENQIKFNREKRNLSVKEVEEYFKKTNMEFKKLKKVCRDDPDFEIKLNNNWTSVFVKYDRLHKDTFIVDKDKILEISENYKNKKAYFLVVSSEPYAEAYLYDLEDIKKSKYEEKPSKGTLARRYQVNPISIRRLHPCLELYYTLIKRIGLLPSQFKSIYEKLLLEQNLGDIQTRLSEFISEKRTEATA